MSGGDPAGGADPLVGVVVHHRADPAHDVTGLGWWTLRVTGGREIAVFPLLYGAARLCIGIPAAMMYEDQWTYPTPADALAAASRWSGQPGTEPSGWTRHQPSGRRRPDGDPCEEYVRA